MINSGIIKSARGWKTRVHSRMEEVLGVRHKITPGKEEDAVLEGQKGVRSSTRRGETGKKERDRH